MNARRAWGAVVALGLLVGCGEIQDPVEGAPDLSRLLPPTSELAGWAVSEGPITHSPETLFEYLDGGADRYLTHGFRQLLHVRYQLGEDPLASITLDIYDMGGELGAFGIYSAARTPQVEIRQWGAEGYREGTVAAAWKGSVYVHGEADDERPELIAMLERLAVTICDGAEGEAALPSALAPLPAEGRVAHSERYIAADLLGHEFLPGGVVATYEIDGQRAELFLSELTSEATADEALVALREHLSKWGTVDDEATSVGAGGFHYTDPTLGAGTAVKAGSFVAGIHGELPGHARERILGELVAALRS